MSKPKKATKKVPIRLTTPEGYKAFCEEWSEKVTPRLQAVDRHQAKSIARAALKIVT